MFAFMKKERHIINASNLNTNPLFNATGSKRLIQFSRYCKLLLTNQKITDLLYGRAPFIAFEFSIVVSLFFKLLKSWELCSGD